MPLFRRSPPKPPSVDLPDGELVEQSVTATLLQGKDALKGTLHLTDRRLLFEARKGDARWMSVPFKEMQKVALYPAPGYAMGVPGSRAQCLWVETAAGEQVWWDFNAKAEQEWLAIVKSRVPAATGEADATPGE
jgi:hypothetical protein